ncbi:AMP-binding protein [Heyndrickxia ginsengihumi]|uniref:AMP-binding protein n=1 Tax=Heyndrickxia ginsengihumi TaxID=363870 RepID=UPI003D23917B
MSELTKRLHQVLAKSKDSFIQEDGQWYSTNEFLTEIEKIQHYLIAANVRPGDRILVSYPNSYQFAYIYFAIIDYGAVVASINPNMPEFELKTFIERANPICGFVGEEHAAFLFHSNRKVHTLKNLFVLNSASNELKRFEYLQEDWYETTIPVVSNPPSIPEPSDDAVAILLYTSGTTGRPKAVGLMHKHILAAAENIIRSHQLSCKDITYCFLPLFHINAQIVALISTCLSDGKIIIAPKFSASKFWNIIQENGVTWVSAVPAIISILLNTPQPDNIPSSLRFIRSASAQLPSLHAKRFEQMTGIPLIQSYGMTEAASQICVNPLPPGKRVLGSVGLPVGLELRIVDDNDKNVEPMNIGEITIRGNNVITFYEQADNQHDFRNGWFHTGDLGYINDEGYVFIVGRKKEMINRGGEKISPYEVEDVIRQIPTIKQVAVIGLPHPVYGEQVAAYVISSLPNVDPKEMIKEVTSHCQNALSNYKCPAIVKVVKEIPVSPTGKIQRKKLKEMEIAYSKVQNH